MKKVLFALVIAAISSATFCQMWSVAHPENAASGVANPAFYGTYEGTMFQTMLSGRKFGDDTRNTVKSTLAMQFLNFGVDFYDEDDYNLWWALSAGSRGGGIGYRSDYHYLGETRQVDWTLGLYSRLARWLSWGAVYADAAKEYRAGLAVRPGFENVTLFSDFVLDDDLEYQNSIVGAEIMPTRGVYLRGNYDIENEGAWLGLRFDFGHTSVSAYADDKFENFDAGITFAEKRFASPTRFKAKNVKLTLAGAYPETPKMLGKNSFRRLAADLTRLCEDNATEKIIIKLESPALTIAQLEEIRGIFEKFKARGGKIIIFAEELGNGGMYFASIADEVVLPPAGGINFCGIGAQSAYYKGLMDKVGLRFDVVHIGKFKTAFENFYADSMSAANRQEIAEILSHIDTLLTNGVAKSKNVTVEKVRSWHAKAPMHADVAVAEGLADTILYWDEFEKYSGWNKATSFAHYTNERDEAKIEWSEPPCIAVIPIEGSIMSGKSSGGGLFSSKTVGDKSMEKIIARAQKDPNIKGIILRIDSPGGSAYASDLIWHAAQNAKEKKPIWISMGSVAASGGYYIAAAGDSIFADRTTITGSIGVVGGKLTFGGLYNKLNVRNETISLSPTFNTYSLVDTFSTLQRELVRKSMEGSYALFKNRVLANRKNLTADSLEDLAQGKVHVGVAALNNGLVDAIAPLIEVERRFAKHLGIENRYDIKMLTPYNTFDFMGMLDEMSLLPSWALISRDIDFAQNVSRENVFAVMPYFITIE